MPVADDEFIAKLRADTAEAIARLNTPLEVQ
jgi:hypothetical protein